MAELFNRSKHLKFSLSVIEVFSHTASNMQRLFVHKYPLMSSPSSTRSYTVE